MYLPLILNRIEYTGEKTRLGSGGGGKKRTVVFARGASDKESVTAPKMLKSEIKVEVADGLPNTSSELNAKTANEGSRLNLQHWYFRTS